jgi:hypothetical protein
MTQDGTDCVVGKKDLFMCRIASIFWLQRLKGRMSGDARDFYNIETLAVINFFIRSRTPKEIHAILTETLGKHATSCAIVKNWETQFILGGFSPVMRLVLQDAKR